MFIDRNGKLFGKVSIVDIIIVLGLLAAVGVFLIKSGPAKAVIPQAQEDEIRISFFTKEVADRFVEKVKPGDAVRDKKSNAVIGHIANVVVEDPLYYGFDTEGKAVATVKPNYKSLTLVITGKGRYSGNESYIGSLDFYEGKELAITAGRIALWSRVVTLENLHK